MNEGAKGAAVGAMQGALKAAGVRRYRPTGTWAHPTTLQVKAFQKRVGIAQTGTYGPRTHEALERFYTPQGAAILRRVEREKHLAEDREAVRGAMRLVVTNRALIHYAGPGSSYIPLRMSGVKGDLHPPQFGRYEDCSSEDTWFKFIVAWPDPNGRGYDGEGFTGTEIQNGRRIEFSELLTNDSVFYGRDRNGNPTHVATYYGDGMVCTNGSEADPRFKPVRYRTDINQIRRYAPE